MSTSSSECEFPGPFVFDTLPSVIRNSFCPAAKQPLVYYAKIPEPFFPPQVSQNGKPNSNCFMKAFRWYTQERESCYKDKDCSSMETSNGFAAWLDNKYNEYLKGSHREGSNALLKQSSTNASERISKKKKSTKKFGRMRSPWRRRRHSSKDKGIPDNTSHESFKFILQPKDYSRAASECCQRISRIQSATTIVSKESPKCIQIKVKSKSLLNVYRAKEKKPNAKNVLCQCFKRDVETQYDTYSLESMAPRNQKVRLPQGEKTFIYQLNSSTRTGVIFSENPARNKPVSQNLSSQTSDNSLNLGEVFLERPILLKVLNADRQPN